MWEKKINLADWKTKKLSNWYELDKQAHNHTCKPNHHRISDLHQAQRNTIHHSSSKLNCDNSQAKRNQKQDGLRHAGEKGENIEAVVPQSARKENGEKLEENVCLEDDREKYGLVSRFVLGPSSLWVVMDFFQSWV